VPASDEACLTRIARRSIERPEGFHIHMHAPQIAAVMIHVPDPQIGLAWYARAFPLATRQRSEAYDFEFLRLGDLQIELVQADAKVGSGAAGSVVYWRVEHLADEVARLQALGATLYRGPLQLDGGLSMCQLQDPWGNCIGLRGPA
jgi:predicted enzyme related to lactoylglutathione lyase